MKSRLKKFFLFSILATAAWTIAAALDWLFLYETDFVAALLPSGNGHMLYTRLLLLGAFSVSWVILSRRSKRFDRDLEKFRREKEALHKQVRDYSREFSEKLNREHSMMQRSKLVALGEMVGAIAHQWRQPLTTVSIILQRLNLAHKQGKLNDTLVRELTRDALGQVKRMSKTIDDFKNYFKPSKASQTFCVKKAVDETLALLQTQMENHLITLHLHYRGDDSLEVSGCSHEFKQVLVNILNNARNAIVEKRRKMHIPAGKGDIFIDVGRMGDDVVVEIGNNGVKIPENKIEEIFNPDFPGRTGTTQPDIGLYLSKAIVENQMRGKIFAANGIDGAVFTIQLKKGVNVDPTTREL